MSPSGNVTLVAGATAKPAGGKASGDETGNHTEARFWHPGGLALQDDGTFFVADTYNSRVRRLVCQQWSALDCGNGSVDSGEQCDDGNLLNGDGCSDKCAIEP